MSFRVLFTASSTIVCALVACQSEPAMSPQEGAADAGVASLDIDLFGVPGHSFRFLVSPEQATAMEEKGFDPGQEDEYTLGSSTYADDVIVTDNADGESVALGKVELKLIGQSTQRPWDRIPNLRVDLDEFQDGLRLDGIEHVRFNNGQVSGIYREVIALRLWNALGYPAPQATFAWAEAPNQWGEDVRVPYSLVEVYKPTFCDRAMQGGCKNLWEAYGEIRELLGQCQFDECDDTGLEKFAEALEQAEPGPGFEAALEPYLDWDAFRSFQCLSWITATGDDYIHNSNNVVVAERTDGKMQFLPYSVDISAGQDWYPHVDLLGRARISMGCQLDPDCWPKLLDRCDEILDSYEALDVVATIVDPAVAELAQCGMERRGDDQRAEFVRKWYDGRAQELRADEIWETVPCVDDEICLDRDDGRTQCRGVCKAPLEESCFDTGCKDGFYCNDFGECIPF